MAGSILRRPVPGADGPPGEGAGVPGPHAEDELGLRGRLGDAGLGGDVRRREPNQGYRLSGAGRKTVSKGKGLDNGK